MEDREKVEHDPGDGGLSNGGGGLGASYLIRVTHCIYICENLRESKYRV